MFENAIFLYCYAPLFALPDEMATAQVVAR
jgi:hypothetical protein